MREHKTIGDINDIKGFFEKYAELKSENFSVLFENATLADIQTMDFVLSDLYGARVLLNKYADMFEEKGADFTMQRIVLIADKICFDNWKAIKNAMMAALLQNNDAPLKSIKTTTSEKSGENATENKVNAFDSETASDSDESSHNYSDSVETTETASYSNGKTASENAKKFIDFANNNDFIETIVKDVLKIACIDVYDGGYCSCRSSSGSGDLQELENRVETIENLIPENATPQNKLATIEDVQSGYDDTAIKQRIATIENEIPSNASPTNKLTTETELRAVESQIPDVSGLATKQELQAVESQIPDVSGLATKQELQAVESQIPDVSGLATKQELQAVESVIPDDTTTSNKLVNTSQLSETVILNVKRKEITNKTITIAQGGFVSFGAVSGENIQPELAFLRLTNFTHATESDCFVSLCSSKYGTHFLFRKVGSYEPIEGQVTISGVLSYIANR